MLNEQSEEFLRELDNIHIHGKNILAKKDRDKIEPFFEEYKIFVEKITDSSLNLENYVNSLNEYKDKVYELNLEAKFSAQSKLESSVLEEFLCVVLKNKFDNDVLHYGAIKAYSSLYFSYNNKASFKDKLKIRVNTKDQDISIFKKVQEKK